MESKISRLSYQIGFWASVVNATAFILYTVCFIGIAATQPLFQWTNLADYLAYVNQYDSTFKDLAMGAMLLFGPAFVLMLSGFHDYAAPEKKALSRISLCFGSIFATLISIHYFIQLSIVRLDIQSGNLAGLEQLIQGNPASASSAVNMLGWTLFLGLASLFIAPVFSGKKLETALRWLFVGNGLCCLLGGIGFIFDIKLLVFFGITLGMGGLLTAAAILSCFFFRRRL